jgi:hypothetical protein
MKRAPLTVVLVPLFPVPATSFAQTEMSNQADSIRAWRIDQVAETEARQSEKAAGIAPSPHGIASGRSHARPKREHRHTPFFWLGRDA